MPEMLALPARCPAPLDTIVHADALTYLRGLPDASVDAVITDPPYNITNCDFETKLDLPMLWKELKRIVKFEGAIVITSAQPFTSMLVMSNLEMFRYEWIWHKTMATGFLNAKLRPMRAHENIIVFSQSSATGGANGQAVKMIYFPQMTKGQSRFIKRGGRYEGYNVKQRISSISGGERYPRSVLTFSNGNSASLHPTQKPLTMMEYLIRTYTQSGDTILDPFAGSGTTLVAARSLGRHYIGCDISAEYVTVARKRLAQPYTLPFPEMLELTG